MLSGAYRHDVTYWAPSSMDGFGNRSFSTPVLLKGRWEDRTDLSIGPVEENKRSKAQVWLQQEVILGGFLAKGNYTSTGTNTPNPTTLATAYQIQQYGEITSLTGNDVIRKALM